VHGRVGAMKFAGARQRQNVPKPWPKQSPVGRRPELPAGSIHFQAPEFQSQAVIKSSAVQTRPKAADPYGTDIRSGRYNRKDDPLNLKQPPQGRDLSQQSAGDGDYLASSMKHDSLLADVEVLLAQEQMLAEQTAWWELRSTREQAAKRRLQAVQQTQEATFRQEVIEMQRQITNTREQHRLEETQCESFLREAAQLRGEAAAAQEEVEVLQQRLEEAGASYPGMRGSVTPPRGTSPRRLSSEAQLSRSPRASFAPPIRATTSPRSGQAGVNLGPVRRSQGGGTNPSGSSMPGNGIYDFADDDDLDMEDLGFR